MIAAEEQAAKREKYSRDEVGSIIKTVLGSIDKTQEPTAKLFQELTKLEEYIESMRNELAQMRTIQISHDHIPAASDELDAVVEETAQATGAIMDSCDKIQAVAEKIDSEEQENELTDAITKIYEACSFQDITGQRITKVCRTLKSIEGKVHEIMKALDQESLEIDEDKDRSEQEKLLQGPQLKGGGATQEEIDALLASFD